MSELDVKPRPELPALPLSTLPAGSPALAGKVVAITGASRGLGRSFVDLCLAEGAFVTALARRPIEGIASDARFLGARGDVRDPDVQDRWLDEVARTAGAVDVLINNAGTIGSDGDLAATLALNVVAPHRLIQRVALAMTSRRRGWIINITSDLARVPAPKQLEYAATKAALDSLTRSWAARFASTGVCVNALHPGWIKTEMNPVGPDEPQSAWPMLLALATCDPRVSGRLFGPAGELAW